MEYFEFYFKFEMKSNVPTLKKKDGTKEIDEEFYPWRQNFKDQVAIKAIMYNKN